MTQSFVQDTKLEVTSTTPLLPWFYTITSPTSTTTASINEMNHKQLSLFCNYTQLYRRQREEEIYRNRNLIEAEYFDRGLVPPTWPICFAAEGTNLPTDQLITYELPSPPVKIPDIEIYLDAWRTITYRPTDPEEEPTLVPINELFPEENTEALEPPLFLKLRHTVNQQVYR